MHGLNYTADVVANGFEQAEFRHRGGFDQGECSLDVIFVWKTPGSDLTRLVTCPGARKP